MEKSLPNSAQSVADSLNEKGIDAKVIEMPASTRTAQEAAEAIGCDVAHIVKSLIFKTKETNRPVLVLASGASMVNEKLIALYVKEKVKKADADFAREVTGFAIGGIPPIGHKQAIELIFIDEALCGYQSVWAAAGTPFTVFNLNGKDLVALTGGQVIAIE